MAATASGSTARMNNFFIARHCDRESCRVANCFSPGKGPPMKFRIAVVVLALGSAAFGILAETQGHRAFPFGGESQ